jgi:hypothetical protein
VRLAGAAVLAVFLVAILYSSSGGVLLVMDKCAQVRGIASVGCTISVQTVCGDCWADCAGLPAC